MTINRNNTNIINSTNHTLLKSEDSPSRNKRWRFVSFLVSISMFSFLFGQSCLALRDEGHIFLPHIIIFPGFILGAFTMLLAGCISAIYGVRKTLSTKLCLTFLGLLTCWSLVQGYYNSTFALREALFSPSGIAVWMAFLLFLPGQNKRFWVYFKKDLFVIFILSLVLQILAIALAFHGNRGLLRVNFSTSISLFIFGWGVLSSNKSLTRWGFIGLLLFGIFSVIHNQRETFLLPVEFLAVLLPVYLSRSFGGRQKQFLSKFLGVIIAAYVISILIPIAYFVAPTKYQQIFSRSSLTDDTRTLVLRDYMSSDMIKPVNYLFGKGVNGFYKSGLRYNPIGGRGTALGIEIGYLQMILNVGIIYALIILIMSFIPAVRGVLKSADPLVVVAGLWVLMRLINMTIAAVPQTDFGWFLFWISIGILNSKEVTKAFTFTEV